MKKFILTQMLLLIAFGVSAELHIVQKKDKYGYADESGKVVIKEQFNQVTPFVNGTAKVQKGDKWGYINENGKEVIKIEYDLIDEFNDKGIARVKKGKKWGYMYKDGSYMIKPEYNFIGTPNEEGYVWVSKGKTLDAGGMGLFKNDKVILKPQYRYFGFYQNTDSVNYEDGHVFTTDEAKEMTQNFSKLSISTIPYIWVDVAYKRGVVDLNGKFVVKCMSYAQGAPSDGLVALRQYNSKKSTYSYNYVLMDGKTKKILSKDITLGIEATEICQPFVNGSALVVTKDDGCYLIDKSGKVISQKYLTATAIGGNKFIVKNGNLMGVINNVGNEIINCKYTDLKAPIGKIQYMSAQNATSKKYGVIDTSDSTIIPFNFDDIAGIMHDKVYVKNSYGWGVIDMNMNNIITPKWSDVTYACNQEDKVIWVKDANDSKWHTLGIENDTPIYDYSFDEVYSFDANGNSIVAKDGKYGAVHSSGYVVIPAIMSSKALASLALNEIENTNKDRMTETEAFRFNIYRNPQRHKYRMHQRIGNEMWDY